MPYKDFCTHKRKIIENRYNKTKIYFCQDCQLVFSQKKLEKINIDRLYKNYYKNEIIGRFKFGIEYVIKLLRFFRAFKIYTISNESKSILDIGCGRGLTLYFLKKYFKFINVIGNQLDKKAYNYCKQKLKINVYNKDFLRLNIKNKTFEIVTMWHVFEHIKDLDKYLQKIKKILKPNGKLIIEVPNYNSWSRKISRKYWLGLDLKYHLNFFTQDSLSKLLLHYGFEIKNIHTFSLEYSIFISVQSIVSRITQSNHLFFQWIQQSSFSIHLIYHIILFGILFLPCFIINLLMQIFNKGEVLLIVAQNRKN